MSAKIIDGKALAAKVKETVWAEAEALPRKPGLAVVLVGDNPASRVYVTSKRKDCEECGFYSEEYALPAETTQKQLLELVAEDKLSAGHARAILAAPSPALQRAAAKRVIEERLSVRQTEALIKTLQKEAKAPQRREDDPIALYLGEVEKSLSGRLGRKVTISAKGEKGRIQLEYYNSQDLESLLTWLQARGREGELYE